MKLKIVLIFFLVLLVILRLALPFILKDQINSIMADFSKIFSAKVADVGVSILRGAYRLEGLEARLKESDSLFLKIEKVDISLAWRDLLSGNIRADLLFEGLDLEVDEALLEALRKNAQQSLKDSQSLGKKVIPLQISWIDVRNSIVKVSDVKKIPKDLKLNLSQIEGRFSNATTSKEAPFSLLKIKGTLQDSAILYVIAELNQEAIPNEWVLYLEIKNFNLPTLNPFIGRVLPLTFRKGQADLYAEAKGENNQVKGYIKPFFKDLDLIGDQKDFKGLKHLGYEITGDLIRLIFTKRPEKTLATRVPFTYEKGSFNWSKGELISNALQHGYVKELPPGIENQFQINRERKQP